MKEVVCGICGEVIEVTDAPCPYCGAEPSHFVDRDSVDVELLRRLYQEGFATY